MKNQHLIGMLLIAGSVSAQTYWVHKPINTLQVKPTVYWQSVASNQLSSEFGTVPLGGSSGAVQYQFTNIGPSVKSLVATITGSDSGDFEMTNQCLDIAPGQNCFVLVQFKPKNNTGTKAAVLNTDVSVHNLSGVGTPANNWEVIGSPDLTLTFADSYLEQDSTTISSIGLKNVSGQVLSLSNEIVIGGLNPTSFKYGSNCSGVASGSSCTVSFLFNPKLIGSNSAVANVFGTNFSMGGNGVQLPPQWTNVSTTGATALGNSYVDYPGSTVFDINMRNTGIQASSLTDIYIDGVNSSDFTYSNNCNAIAVNGTCKVTAWIYPRSEGSKSATLHVNGVAYGLTGSGVAPPPQWTVVSVPNPIDLGTTPNGTTSAETLVTIKNTGLQTASASFGFYGTNSTAFVVSTNTCTNVAVNSNCTIGFKFTASAVQAYTAKVQIAGAEYVINGTGVAASAGITNYGTYRGWSDGTAANSCKAYLTGDATHKYEGATGDGVYLLNINGNAVYTYCDMTSGGWTLVAHGEGFPWTTQNTWYNTTGSVNLSNSPSPANTSTWKYADSLINGISKSWYKVQYKGSNALFSGACVYNHMAVPAANSACSISYANESGTVMKRGEGWGNGLSDYRTSDGTFNVVTNNQGSQGWQVKYGAVTYYGYTGGSTYYTDLDIWVK